MKRILILTLRPLHNGPRIIREINTLKSNYEITVVGLTKPEIKGVKFYNILQVHKSIIDRLLRKVYRLFRGGEPPMFKLPHLSTFTNRVIKREKPDIIILHEPDFFPYMFKTKHKRKYKVVFNAHEYYPLQFESRPRWSETYGKFYRKLYENYLLHVDLMVNVCDTIADKCLSEFNKPSIVIPNAAAYDARINVQESKGLPLRLIHHGVAIRARGLETMIEAVGTLEGLFELDLMLVQNHKDYFDELKSKAALTKNVRIIPPVSFDEIVPFISSYDIGLYILKPNSFNQEAALPNKLFEFIQARLCLVVGPSLEMSRVVRRHKVGVVAKDFSVDSLVELLKGLRLEDVHKFKTNSDIAARELCAENYEDLFLNSILSLK